MTKTEVTKLIEEEEKKSDGVTKMPPEDDSVSSEEEDDDLVLEGVVIRNPDISSSSDEEDSEEEVEMKPPAKKQKMGDDKSEARATSKNMSSMKKKDKRSHSSEPEMIQVDFTFCDMDEKFFHGIKTLLHSSSSVYAAESSSLSDLMIENVSVGTVISTEGDDEHNVFGFASVLNMTTNASNPGIQYLNKLCLEHCPSEHKAEMETVLSGKTKRPAGYLLHSRMVNLPLEIVQVLHQQLVLDMDWAVENAQGGEEERKSLDFGAFVRLAPATAGSHGSIDYKYFDDEIFATNAEFVYIMDAPKVFGAEVKHLVSVIVMTKTGHRAAMKDLSKLVGG